MCNRKDLLDVPGWWSKIRLQKGGDWMVMSLKNVVVPHPRLYFSCRLVQFRGVAFVGKASVYPAHFHTSAASQQFGEANLRHPAVSSGSILSTSMIRKIIRFRTRPTIRRGDQKRSGFLLLVLRIKTSLSIKNSGIEHQS